ncbi:hypothetical protein H6G36_03310 [Anabaena minutissima FACHB-250]|nr:hypothetical protein [Anabaena minutissima FACHB-250]
MTITRMLETGQFTLPDEFPCGDRTQQHSPGFSTPSDAEERGKTELHFLGT